MKKDRLNKNEWLISMTIVEKSSYKSFESDELFLIHCCRMSIAGGSSNDVRCEYCSMSFTNRSLYEQHSQICPKAFIICPFKKFGCSTQVQFIFLCSQTTDLSFLAK
jgi:hypothetical protein